MKNTSTKSLQSAFEKLPRAAIATAIGAIVAATQAHAADTTDAKPASTAACDPYKNYECLDQYLGDGFWGRLANYYSLEWGQGAAPSDPKAPPARRDYFPPAAQSTPPMPFTEWPYGGTTSLGVTRPASVDSPLMVALADTSLGKWMADNNLQVYGWVNAGANLSTSKTKPGGNAPAAYDYTPNTAQFDQAVVYLERLPDTVQKDHIDWGMRISAMYGADYRYTTAYGLLSNQLLRDNKANGLDLPMLYGEVFIPQVAEGLMVRVGRFISVPDIEAQLAPNNYMYSHSMSYSFDNFTNTGVLGSLAVTKNWTAQLGIVAGTESTLGHLTKREDNPYPNVPGSVSGQPGYNPLYPGNTFKADPGAMPSLTACGRYDADDGKTDVNVCADGINKGTYGYNNLQWYGLTFYHSFNDKWHISAEAYHLFQKKVPNALNSDVQTIYANGGAPFSSRFLPFNAPDLAQCSNSAALTCTAGATGVVAYLNYSPDALNNFSIRPEFYRDPQGQRTGTRATYKNLALGWQHWLSPQIELRPEIAYYHSSALSFNGSANEGIAPNRRTETVISGDVIFHF
jgi:hypothetical protein